jgi:hypothetical protein
VKGGGGRRRGREEEKRGRRRGTEKGGKREGKTIERIGIGKRENRDREEKEKGNEVWSRRIKE